MAKPNLTLNALKLTSALVIGAAFTAGAPALAGPDGDDVAVDMQDHTPRSGWSGSPVPGDAHYFAAADLNGDGALDTEEYAVFVDTLADRGDADMIAVRDSAGYVQSFAVSDSNVDNVLSYDEIRGEVADDNMSEEPSEIEPY